MPSHTFLVTVQTGDQATENQAQEALTAALDDLIALKLPIPGVWFTDADIQAVDVAPIPA